MVRRLPFKGFGVYYVQAGSQSTASVSSCIAEIADKMNIGADEVTKKLGLSSKISRNFWQKISGNLF